MKIKNIFISIIMVALLAVFHAMAWAAGASTTATNAGTSFKTGSAVTITATADNATGVFNMISFAPDDSTAANVTIYNDILGRWITSARTTPGGFSSAGLYQYPPTANYDVYLFEKTATDDFLITTPTLAIGTTTTAVSSIAFTYVINGVAYSKAAVADGTAPGNDVIITAKYGAVALDIGADGTIDAIEATGQAAAQFTSAALAVAALPACASDHVRLGHVTATKSDGAFTFGTTALNAANSTVAYTSTIPAYNLFGGRLTNRSATASEEVYAGNTDGDNQYVFIKKPVILVITGNSVNSAVTVIDLNFN